uniref:Uncharacterized protein n=1 Tax=Cacopsylla melanoneura TaxID=428564 RepID=A0A8D9BV49_9HEMI
MWVIWIGRTSLPRDATSPASGHNWPRHNCRKASSRSPSIRSSKPTIRPPIWTSCRHRTRRSPGRIWSAICRWHGRRHESRTSRVNSFMRMRGQIGWRTLRSLFQVRITPTFRRSATAVSRTKCTSRPRSCTTTCPTLPVSPSRWST